MSIHLVSVAVFLLTKRRLLALVATISIVRYVIMALHYVQLALRRHKNLAAGMQRIVEKSAHRSKDSFSSDVPRLSLVRTPGTFAR